jgi:hypothetical protein
LSSEIVDRELNDEELDKVSSKDDIRRELSSLLALEAASQAEEMKRTSLTTASAKEATKNKVPEHTFQKDSELIFTFIHVTGIGNCRNDPIIHVLLFLLCQG